MGVDVDSNDVLEFIENACPSCGSREWTIIGNEEHTASIIMFPGTGGWGFPLPRMPVAPIVCKNCGFLRLHSLKVIEEWKKSK